MADIRRRKGEDEKPEVYSGADSSDHVSFFFLFVIIFRLRSFIDNERREYFFLFDFLF